MDNYADTLAIIRKQAWPPELAEFEKFKGQTVCIGYWLKSATEKREWIEFVSENFSSAPGSLEFTKLMLQRLESGKALYPSIIFAADIKIDKGKNGTTIWLNPSYRPPVYDQINGDGENK